MEQGKLRDQVGFLSTYYKKGDCFPNLLSRSTYLSKFSRDGEVWTDTILRVVDGNCDLDPVVTMDERKKLFHTFWTMQGMPPGRGLWVGGVPNIPSDARYNCWYTTIYEPNDWGWIANQLMLGGGVGVGLSQIGQLPIVGRGEATFKVRCDITHPNFSDVAPDLQGGPGYYVVPDSREGWVTALTSVMDCAYGSRSLLLDVSKIRPRGAPIKTFGGTACGPGPLVDLLRAAWGIVRTAQGRKLRSVEALDVTNHVGKCIKAGNVRRSALIALGLPDDQPFRDAKKDWNAVTSHRHTSNNSIMFSKFSQLENFDWLGLAKDNSEFGEPGVYNLALTRRTDPRAKGINPCGEIPLDDREACNLAEVFPARVLELEGSIDETLRLIARYSLRQRLTALSDARADKVRRETMRVGVGLGGICDFEWSKEILAVWAKIVRQECDDYAVTLGVSRPVAVTTVKPSGTISLLNCSSPGIHAPHSEYYIRRTRIANVEPMAQELKAAGVPWEHDVYDSSGHTLVFSFPMKAKHTRITTQTETLRDQFDRQLTVQNAWSDNAVSATISFDKSNPRELAMAMKEYIPQLKSTSCLPREHGYQQAPYEQIDNDTFTSMSKGIDFNATLVAGRGAEMDIQECSTGACPVR